MPRTSIPTLAALYLLASGAFLCAQAPEPISDEAIVRKDAGSAKYCPDAADGEICTMTLQEAFAYCKEQGGHHASTREFARFMNAGAILEVDQLVDGKAPEGYYEVSCMDELGQPDVFYFNNERGQNGEKPRVLTGDLAKHSFWTSSLVKGKPEFAHVFYGPLGGGGGTPEDHHRDKRHGVILIKPTPLK